jgi:hypothetical protein
MSHIQAHCNACGGDRTHDQLHHEKTSWEIESFDIRGIDTFETLKCLGCGEIKLRHTKWVSDEDPRVTYFPPAAFRPEPSWLGELWQELPLGEEQILTLLREVYIALHNNLLTLAAMGVRALIERIMILKTGDHKTFGENLKQFEGAGFVSRIQRERLQAVLEVGHAAIHRGLTPTRQDMITVLDIVEHLVETVYIQQEKLIALKVRIPKRSKRAGA